MRPIVSAFIGAKALVIAGVIAIAAIVPFRRELHAALSSIACRTTTGMGECSTTTEGFCICVDLAKTVGDPPNANIVTQREFFIHAPLFNTTTTTFSNSNVIDISGPPTSTLSISAATIDGASSTSITISSSGIRSNGTLTIGDAAPDWSTVAGRLCCDSEDCARGGVRFGLFQVSASRTRLHSQASYLGPRRELHSCLDGRWLF